MSENERHINVLDTNVPIYDFKSIDKLRDGGKNIVTIPFVVQFVELDKLKKEPRTKLDAIDAINLIHEIYKTGDPSLEICDSPGARHLKGLNLNHPDHLVVATAIMLKEQLNGKHKNYRNEKYRDFDNVRLISMDTNVRILAKKFGVEAEDYREARVDEPIFEPPKRISVNLRWENLEKFGNGKNNGNGDSPLCFPYDPDEYGEIIENEGVVCFGNQDGPDWQKAFAAIRRGDYLKILPNNINAMGIKPYSINGNGPNWSQNIALGQLMDPDIDLVFLQGGAGTGKTLLAIASAFQQRHDFRKIIVTRPPVHIDGKDRLGFLPGDLNAKLSHWMVPIEQSVDFLKEINDIKAREEEEKGKKGKTPNDKIPGPKGKNGNKASLIAGRKNLKEIKDIVDQKKVWYVSLDLLRGWTFHKMIVIVDEAQNLTPHHVETIITRAGEKSKIIFTGDLAQIDLATRIDKRSSGLTHWMKETMDEPLIANVTFQESVRSRLVSRIEEISRKNKQRKLN